MVPSSMATDPMRAWMTSFSTNSQSCVGSWRRQTSMASPSVDAEVLDRKATKLKSPSQSTETASPRNSVWSKRLSSGSAPEKLVKMKSRSHSYVARLKS